LAGDLPAADVQEVVVSHKKPVLPVVEVDQAFPLLTIEGAARGGAPSTGAADQTPTVTAVIRDVLGWRPRRQDTKAFTAALDASFELETVEGHIEARYRPRGYAVQADLGGVTGGQASLYTRAKTSHVEINRILDALKPLRPDADPEDCEAYRALVRDSVRQIVSELGMPGGPRVELVDSAFTLLTGHQFGGQPGFSVGPPTLGATLHPQHGQGPLPRGATLLPLASPGTTVDDIPGQLGAMRDRFGLTDDNVNTVEEEQVRTAFLTLVDLIVDLQGSWARQRVAFGDDLGRGFLGTELVLINRLMAAAAEQVDELEAVLESALVSSAERQTIVLDTRTRLTLDGLLDWMRTFLAEDGPRIARDTGRDGLTTSFTPTVLAILQALRCTLVARLVPCGSSSCGGPGGCRCSHKGVVAYLPLGCCSPLPPGMYAGRTKIAVSGLCGLLERLARAAARIGRFSRAVLLDVVVTPFDDLDQQLSTHLTSTKFVRVEVRGLHLRPTYLPAFVATGSGRRLEDLVLPVRGSASADADSVVGVFDSELLAPALQAGSLGDGAVFAAADVPLALVDGETGRIVTAPPVTTWPDLRPATTPSGTSGPADWTQPSDQSWVPQSTDPSPPEEEVCEPDDCTEPCRCTEPCKRECDKECDDKCDCDCGCHSEPKFAATIEGAGQYRSNLRVLWAADDLLSTLDDTELLAGRREAVEGIALSVRDRDDELRQKVDDLRAAVRDAARTTTAQRRATAPAQAGREPDLRPASERFASIRDDLDQAQQDLDMAELRADQAKKLAERHAEESNEVRAAARDADELATIHKELAAQSKQAEVEADTAHRAAIRRHAELTRQFRVAGLAAQKEQEVARVEEPPVETDRGEPITVGNIDRWAKEEGDPVEAGEPIAVMSTHGESVEVRSPVKGLLRSIAVPAGQPVKVGADLVVIEQDDGTTVALAPTVALGMSRGTAERQGQPAEEEQQPPAEADEKRPAAKEDEQAPAAKEEPPAAQTGKAATESRTTRKGRTTKSSSSGSTSGGRRPTRQKNK
jgi:pyruvate/2-oxoglutarate dehydrogenase complex dihydrolipoamide acyltransferase (E2) component